MNCFQLYYETSAYCIYKVQQRWGEHCSWVMKWGSEKDLRSHDSRKGMWTTVADAVWFVTMQHQHTLCLNLGKTVMNVGELFYFTFINVYNSGLDRDTFTKFIMLCNHLFYLYFTNGFGKSYMFTLPQSCCWMCLVMLRILILFDVCFFLDSRLSFVNTQKIWLHCQYVAERAA
jgi:hypothetical protein